VRASKRLANILETALKNGHKVLSFEQLTAKAKGVAVGAVTPNDVMKMRWDLDSARHRLQRDKIITILVTQHYIDSFTGKREPASMQQAYDCCALHGRRAAGIRLATLKNTKNDIMCIAWLHLNGLVSRGIQRNNLDRIAVEFDAKHLTSARAALLKSDVTDAGKPLHVPEFKKLLQLEDRKR